MTAKASATWKWAIGIVITLGLVVAANALAQGIFQGETNKQVEHNHEEIVGVKANIKDMIVPELLRSKKHVDQAEIETPMIMGKIEDLEDEFKGFRKEQTAMKEEIIAAVREKNDNP